MTAAFASSEGDSSRGAAVRPGWWSTTSRRRPLMSQAFEPSARARPAQSGARVRGHESRLPADAARHEGQLDQQVRRPDRAATRPPGRPLSLHVGRRSPRGSAGRPAHDPRGGEGPGRARLPSSVGHGSASAPGPERAQESGRPWESKSTGTSARRCAGCPGTPGHDVGAPVQGRGTQGADEGGVLRRPPPARRRGRPRGRRRGARPGRCAPGHPVPRVRGRRGRGRPRRPGP